VIGAEGRIPLRIRVGVTGHRALRNANAVSAGVDRAISLLERALPSEPATPVLYEVVSPLGEGADRIVAERFLEIPTTILEAPLPLAPTEYERDFGSDESTHEFRRLLERAERVSVAGDGTRPSSYREVGQYVVQTCDVLIAVWDGRIARGEGGTQEILELARARSMPALVIDAEPPFAVHPERLPVDFPLFDAVRRYNKPDLGSAPKASPLVSHARASTDDERLAVDGCLSWIGPAFDRADTLATRYRMLFTSISRLMFLASALAITSAAISVVSTQEHVVSVFAKLEVGLMLLALAMWLVVRRRLHDRWTTARFLAERLRSALFLAIVGSPGDIEPKPEGNPRGNGDQEWLTRVFREVWRSRPRVVRSNADIRWLKDLLIREWVEAQIGYHRERGRHHATASRLVTTLTAILFLTTIAAASAHAFGWAEGANAHAVAVLSIALPAFAGATTAIAGLEQHPRHAARFATMTRRLEQLENRLRRTDDLVGVNDVALRIEAELRTETESWIDVMTFRDVEIPI
jgi:SMODS and SLOG-associating 2TM effector domain 1